MSSPFTVLGVDLTADDDAIRKRYIELIREFSPETAPEKFAAIREAFEAIGNVHKRANFLIDPGKRGESIDQLLEDYERTMPRKRNTLDELIQATDTPTS
ncbi:MAG: J domain-containing protein [Fimbriiglobus sp.]